MSVFRGDAPHGPHGHAAQGRDVLPGVPRPPKHLHLVSLEHVDHPSLAGDGISDDLLVRWGYRQVARISGKDVVRIFGTRNRYGSLAGGAGSR
jgi:hypothetical protein